MKKKLASLRPIAVRSTEQNAFRGGSYSLVLSVIVFAILLVINIFVASLPPHLTKYDMSASRLYSITSNTKAVVNNLKKDVTIYWVVQSGKEDEVIRNLLDKYDSLSERITVVKKNPDVYPTFTEKFTSGSVPNNSIIVECDDRSRYISYNDIYLKESNPYYYSTSVSFDGEGAITSAIDYVVNESQPQIYLLQGHGEKELPSSFRRQMDKDNFEIQTFSLLTSDEIPQEAAAIVIYAPGSDISPMEKDMLLDYVEDGGKLLVVTGPQRDGKLKQLSSLLEQFGITVHDGIIIESDRGRYAFQEPYLLMPKLESSDITDSLIDEKYYPIFPISQGYTISSTADGVTSLMSTSKNSFSKLAGYDLATYEKEEGDIDGPFSIALTIDTIRNGKIVWFGSAEFLSDMYNSYSSGANLDLAMNALSALSGEREAIAIRSKSLDYKYLTISDSTSSLLKMIMIGVCPLAYMIIGMTIIIQRRRKQHEAK